METMKVKCPKNLILEIEKTSKAMFMCPTTCPLKRSRKCKNTYFTINNQVDDSANSDICLVHKNETSNHNLVHNDNVVNNSNANNLQSNNSYRSPFASSRQPLNAITNQNTSNVQNHAPLSSSNQQVIDKYNMELSSSDIFTGIPVLNIGDICLKIGYMEFHYGYVPGSEGNLSEAIRYIFTHWYYSKVFTKDLSKYTIEFLTILKTSGFTTMTKELTELIENKNLNVNQKFYRLFNEIIYKDTQTRFYWSEDESPRAPVIALFDDLNDFAEKLVLEPNFLEVVSPCFNEVLSYLKLTEEEMSYRIPKIIYDKLSTVSYMDNAYGRYTLVKLGNKTEFIKNWTKLCSYEELIRKYNFLKLFKIDKNYDLVARNGSFELNISNYQEDNSVYYFTGIINNNSNICATIYNYYMTLIKEYIEVFEPTNVEIGRINFSIRNFYHEVVSIIENGCIVSTNQLIQYNKNEKALFEMLKSLIRRHILDVYIDRCENNYNLEYIVDNFINEDKINVMKYFGFSDCKHYIYSEFGKTTMDEYILKILEQDFITAQSRLANDEFVKSWVNCKSDAKKITRKVNQLNRLQ